MQQLVAFFLRFNALFVCVVLEILSLYLYFSFNQNTQKAAFLSTANRFVGGIFDYGSRLSNQWNLLAVNDSLARENAKLKMQLPDAQYSALVKTTPVNDSVSLQQFTYVEARVVNNSINKAHNFLTINRGSRHGLVPNSGVVSATGDGIVGIVRKVSTYYSVVMSIFNKETRISAKIRKNNYFGILTWDGVTLTHLNLEGVPKHAPVAKGDTILTSGYSTMFPEGIFVGIVDTCYIDAGSNAHTVKVRLVTDVSNIQYVYVVDDLLKKEREQLEKEVLNNEQ
jgi:rod shape-determining protein MreC